MSLADSGGVVRILDQDSDKSINAVIIYLTQAEAGELRDSLEQIIADPVGRHEHVSSSDNAKEITVCLYDVNKLEQFDLRSKKLIQEDK
jgi:hypothetical protein